MRYNCLRAFFPVCPWHSLPGQTCRCTCGSYIRIAAEKDYRGQCTRHSSEERTTVTAYPNIFAMNQETVYMVYIACLEGKETLKVH